jgi:uncharacterized protein (TIGR00730 family)
MSNSSPQRLCVFAGSNLGVDPAYRQAAEVLGRLLAERGMGIVYGGAHVGLMGALADAALGAGGEVIGVIPNMLAEHEVAHDRLSELHVVETMHQRKALMSELSDSVLALPGGLGTFEELFEVATWSQLGIRVRPCGLLDVGGYYEPLVALLDHAVSKGFLSAEHRSIVLVEGDPERMLARLSSWVAPPTILGVSGGVADLDR